MTNDSAIPFDLQQGILLLEACEHIADFIAASRHKNDFKASCYTDEGQHVSVEKSFCEDVHAHEEFHITVLDVDEEVIVDVIVPDNGVEILMSLKAQHERAAARRKFLAEEDELLAKEEVDLYRHIQACVMGLCSGDAE